MALLQVSVTENRYFQTIFSKPVHLEVKDYLPNDLRNAWKNPFMAQSKPGFIVDQCG
jgi:hypothetical protein